METLSTSLRYAAAFGGAVLSAGLPSVAQAASCAQPALLTSDASGTFCAVSVTAYSHGEACSGTINGTAAHSGQTYLRTSNGQSYSVLCAADFQSAATAAGRYFSSGKGLGQPFKISLPPGRFYVPDTAKVPQNAVMSLPVNNGTLAAPLSFVERLIIEGSTDNQGNNLTTVLSNWQLTTFLAAPGANTSKPAPFSHLTISNLNFDRDQFSTSQGSQIVLTTVPEQISTKSPSGKTAVTTVMTQAMEMVVDGTAIGQPGFNTPDFNFQPAANPPAASGNTTYQQYLRLYDNVQDPATGVMTPVLDTAVNGSVNGSLATAVFNNQIFYHGVCGGTMKKPLDDYATSSNGTTVTASFACPSSGNTYTLLLGNVAGQLSTAEAQAVASYVAIPANANPIVCTKSEGSSGNFLLIANDQAQNPATGAFATGTDIVLNHLIWMGQGRSAFRNTANISILNSSILREPAVNHQAPCLSSDAGGPQLVGTAPWITYGNVISGYTAIATGDDSLAIFGDVGGTGTYAVTTVTNTKISDSFARGVLIVPPANQPAAENFLSSVNIYPYAGISNAGTLCTGNGVLGTPGFDPANVAGTCSFPEAAPNMITNIYQPCQYPANNSLSNDTFCPVRVLPTP